MAEVSKQKIEQVKIIDIFKLREYVSMISCYFSLFNREHTT